MMVIIAVIDSQIAYKMQESRRKLESDGARNKSQKIGGTRLSAHVKDE